MAAEQVSESAQQSESSQPGIGERLRAAREDQQLAIEDVAAELRISQEALRALEAERFDALGAPVFAKGYLKQYGARLGLDVAALVADYETSPARPRVEIAPSKTIKLRDERQITAWLVVGLAFVLIVAFLAYWWLGQPGAFFG